MIFPQLFAARAGIAVAFRIKGEVAARSCPSVRSDLSIRVLLLVQDLHIRVINADTGELIRELVLNPDKRYQPTGKPSGWPKKTPRPLCGFAVSSMS